MTAVLATVNVKKELYGPTANEYAAIAPNIPMGLLHAYADVHNVPIEMIDSEIEQYSIEELLDKLEELKPQLVGIIATGPNPSASTMSMVGVINFFNQLKQRKNIKFKTFIYGGHPTVLPERSLCETGADFALIGEGYEALVGLYQHICGEKALEEINGLGYFKNGKYIQCDPPELIDIDSLPMVQWDKMNPLKYRAHNWHCFNDINNRSPYAIIWTNMGCPYPCEFCCINNLFGKRKFRFRSIKNVISEIDLLVNKYSVKNLKILDELFIIKHPRIDEFCDRLEERNYDLNMWCFARTDSVDLRILKRLKKVGLKWIAYGFESIDDSVLNGANKGLTTQSTVELYEQVIHWTKEAEINICADLIVGLWEDNQATIESSINFMKKHEIEWMNIYPCFALPGTILYDQCIADGVIETPETWNRYSLYGYDCEPLPTKHLTSETILQLRDNMFQQYYQDKDILNMLELKFGANTRRHVEQMAQVPLKRKLLDQRAIVSE